VDAPTFFDAVVGNCVQQIQGNGYSYGSVAPCSQCFDNSVNLSVACKGMIDCVASSWPCTGNCWTDCRDSVGGSGVVDTCVSNLTNAACQ
jgi:hypothetical protein